MTADQPVVASLTSTAAHDKVPQHVGVILDGNRRWACERLVDVTDTYRAGAAKVPWFLSRCECAGVAVVSLWALSEDNLARSAQEVEPLLRIITETLEEISSRHRWRLRMIGRLELVAADIADRLHAVEQRTAEHDGLIVNIAVAYDGRTDIVAAVRRLLEQGVVVDCTLESLRRMLASRLSTAGLPDPDLMIRTSGELRTSGFLLWQGAQAEWFFTDKAWPEFAEEDLRTALDGFRARDRRFGR